MTGVTLALIVAAFVLLLVALALAVGDDNAPVEPWSPGDPPGRTQAMTSARPASRPAPVPDFAVGAPGSAGVSRDGVRVPPEAPSRAGVGASAVDPTAAAPLAAVGVAASPLPHLRSGAEPLGMARTRSARAPRATAAVFDGRPLDGDSAGSERAMASASPERPVSRPSSPA